ncbi:MULTISPECIES: VC2046/SO_2500 family protein [Pseudomonadati]|uniref:QueD-like protein n=1 Tax=Shewanella aestuarii TaxID=1028752 RepID=A0ABT0KXD5_9GAMM|nr:VC2046/SO_2500 family protein [Shewanella aestuarii]MCL1116127.1 queD-like protein [Shewanella aestuarii]GGN70560.1 queD-like protein [Shewanella aestuarii]
MQIESLLINELQLGSRLNAAVEHQRRGEFALLLALLSADSSDMAQFQFDKDLTINQKLYKKFELPQPQALVDDLSTSSQHKDNSLVFHSHGLRQFHLQQNLSPEAMVIRGKHQDGIAQVLSNTSVLIKSKYENNQVSPELLEDMHFVEQLERQRQISQTMQICA